MKVETAYSSAARTFSITASQSVPPTLGQEAKVPVLVPLRIALLAPDGSPLPLHLEVGSCIAQCKRQEYVIHSNVQYKAADMEDH